MGDPNATQPLTEKRVLQFESTNEGVDACRGSPYCIVIEASSLSTVSAFVTRPSSCADRLLLCCCRPRERWRPVGGAARSPACLLFVPTRSSTRGDHALRGTARGSGVSLECLSHSLSRLGTRGRVLYCTSPCTVTCCARVGGCGRRVSASSDDRDPDAIDDVLHRAWLTLSTAATHSARTSARCDRFTHLTWTALVMCI